MEKYLVSIRLYVDITMAKQQMSQPLYVVHTVPYLSRVNSTYKSGFEAQHLFVQC